MFYSIQNSSGEVYGMFPMPSTNQSAEVWAAELSAELNDILGINGVRSSQLPVADGGGGYTPVDRVVIDIEPVYADEAARVERVHETIGRLASAHRTGNA